MKKKTTATRYSDEVKVLAKKMYMDYASVSEIARETGMSRAAVYNQIKKWSVERDMLRAELMEKVVSAKQKDFAKIAVSAITIMGRSLEDLANRDVPPSVAEAQKAMQIFDALDRITRLDNGDPTEITSEKPVSIKAIRAKIGANPFNETVEEIDYEEIEDGADSGSNTST